MLPLLLGLCLLAAINLIQVSGGDYLYRRRLATFNPVVDLGSPSFLPNRTVFAAVVHIPHATDDGLSAVNHGPNAQQRSNVQRMQAALPIPLVSWPAIGALPCPQYLRTSHSSHRFEKGHGVSHFQVWADFLFFDRDVLEARFRPKPEYVESTSYSSVSGHFQAFENGSLYKNRIPYLEEDVLVVLEDSLHVSNRSDVSEQLQQALSQMNSTELLRLGHCVHAHRAVSPARHAEPWCVFAYAATRRTYRRLLDHFDLCGRSLDQQLHHMERMGYISIRTLESSLFSHGRSNSTISSGSGHSAAGGVPLS